MNERDVKLAGRKKDNPEGVEYAVYDHYLLGYSMGFTGTSVDDKFWERFNNKGIMHSLAFVIGLKSGRVSDILFTDGQLIRAVEDHLILEDHELT